MPFRPKPVLLYTGSDSSLAGDLTAGAVPAPKVTMAVLMGVMRYLQGFAATFGDVNALTIPAELLSLVGLNLGSSSRMNAAGVYIEPAMQGVSIAAGLCKEAKDVLVFLKWLGICGDNVLLAHRYCHGRNDMDLTLEVNLEERMLGQILTTNS